MLLALPAGALDEVVAAGARVGDFAGASTALVDNDAVCAWGACTSKKKRSTSQPKKKTK